MACIGRILQHAETLAKALGPAVLSPICEGEVCLLYARVRGVSLSLVYLLACGLQMVAPLKAGEKRWLDFGFFLLR